MPPLVTPSHLNNWNGTPLHGSEFTVEQTASMARWRARIQGAKRRYGLPSTYSVTKKMMKDSLMGPIPTYVGIPCPVVTCSKDRKRLQVIAPNGYTEWVEWKQ